MRREWYPEGARRRFDPPAVGDMVAIDYMSLRVWDISPSPRDETLTRYALRREHGPVHPREAPLGDLVVTTRGRPLWWVYEDGVLPLCSCHGWPWPCKPRCETQQALSDIRAAAEMAERAHDGLCLACGEPVTTRQGRVLAPEPNVALPGFPAPLFHTRQKCREGLQEYDRARRRRLGANWAPLLSDRQDALVHPQEGQ